MNTVTRGAMDAYAKAGVEASIRDSSPHQLISMLFDGAIVALGMAKNHMRLKQVAAKGQLISKAISIIDEGLKVSLDEEAGGELAQNLKALYEYMSYRLLMANLHNDEAGLDEVSRLLSDLKSAWDAIGKNAVAKPAAPLPTDVPQRTASVSYGKA